MRMCKRAVMAALLVIGGASAASAATFNFAGPEREATTFSFSEDGIGLVASSGNFIDPTDTILPALPGQTVTQAAGGLGVDRFDLGPLEGDPPVINGATDLLILTFDRLVRFDSISFSRVDADDDFDLALDGVFIIEDENILAMNPYVFGSGVTGYAVAIGADSVGGALGFGGDDFRVKAIDVTAVPAPAALPLLLAALAGLGYAARRRRG